MTLPIVLTIAGCAALLVGLFGGGVKAKEIEVPQISLLPRIISSLTGLVLIGVAIWVSQNPPAETPAVETPPAPILPSAVPPTQIVPIEVSPTNVPPTQVPPTATATWTLIPTLNPTATVIPPTTTQAPQSVCDQYKTIPLQLYWSEERQDNITVARAESVNGATSANYRFVSTEGYVLQNPQSGTIPLVLYYEGYTFFDNFTVATSEGIAQAIAAGYWRVSDNVEGYIFTTQYPGTIPLNLYYHAGRSDNFTTASKTGQADAKTWNYQFIRTEGYVCP